MGVFLLITIWKNQLYAYNEMRYRNKHLKNTMQKKYILLYIASDSL